MSTRIATLAAVGLAGLALAPQLALSARAPTLSERAAITQALPKRIRHVPTECVWLRMKVSRNPRYALVTPVWLDTDPTSSCLRYAGDGFFVLRKVRSWRPIYLGSELPPCSLRIPRDLVRCLP